MDKRVLQLGHELENAAFEENWDEIRRIDARISQLLKAIRKQGLQKKMQDELSQLRKSHLRVAKVCREQHDILQMKIQQHQHTREGLQAYALFSSDKEDNE